MKRITVSLCSGKTGYEVNTSTNIDLLAACRDIEAKVKTRHIVILEFGGAEISLYPSGRMLVKKVKSEAEALDAAKLLLERLSVRVDWD
ncbi:MAG TPA: hypothetical protein HA257_05665 [Candidatus Methanoperedenaceae archaeon]|nr:hypothetical protein [Candidatus Methanoperedenaceae archaeon]